MWRGLLVILMLAALPAWADEPQAVALSLDAASRVGAVRMNLYPDFRTYAPEEKSAPLIPFGKPFDRRDKELVALSSVLLLVDWGQTLNLSRQPECYCETNAILGEHPSAKDVNRYFAAAMLGNLALSRILEGKWRRAWLWTLSALQLNVTRNNESIGLQVRF